MMPKLQDFIQQRHDTQKNLQRQELGDKLKVVVPSPKFERNESGSGILNPSKSLAAGRPSVQQSFRHHLGLPFDQHSNGNGGGFDTDVEGLEDSTVVSSTYDNTTALGIRPGLSHNDRKLAERNGFEHQEHVLSRPLDGRRGPNPSRTGLETEDAGAEEECDSYEENGEGEEEGYEEDIEQDLTDDSVQGLHSPGHFQFHQEGTTLSEEGGLNPLMKVPSTLDHGLKNTKSQPPRLYSRSPPDAHISISNTLDSDAQWQREHQRQCPAGVKGTFSLNLRRSTNPSRLLVQSSQPTALQRTLPVNHQVSQQPFPSGFQSLSPDSQSRENRLTSKPGSTETMDALSIGGRDLGTPPVFRPKDAPGAEKPREHLAQRMKPNADNEGDPRSVRNTGIRHADVTTSSEASAASDKEGNRQKRRRDLDYGLDQLGSMEFQQLKEESFHVDPQSSGAAIPTDLADSSLVGKLNYLMNLEDDDSRALQQGTFLNSLPIEEYEKCGDLIVERFNDLVKKFKNARQERRRAAHEFEKEVARREECVREKLNAFEKDFDRLKRSGEDVVRKKLAT